MAWLLRKCAENHHTICFINCIPLNGTYIGTKGRDAYFRVCNVAQLGSYGTHTAGVDKYFRLQQRDKF